MDDYEPTSKDYAGSPAATGSEKAKHLLNVYVWGEYAGAYEYDTLDEALKAEEKRTARFSSLGCRYRIEYPNNEVTNGSEPSEIQRKKDTQ